MGSMGRPVHEPVRSCEEDSMIEPVADWDYIDPYYVRRTDDRIGRRRAYLRPNRYGARRKVMRRWQRAASVAYHWELYGRPID